MQSQSKAAVAQDDLEKIVSVHLGAGTRLKAATELKEGYFNTAYLLELADGFKCVLKIAPPETLCTLTYEHHILTTEFEMMALARNHTEMPVPQIYGTDTTRQHLNRDYYLMEFLTGVPLHQLRKSLSDEEQATIDHELGRLTFQLNAIIGTYFGYPGLAQLQGATWKETFARLLESVLSDGQAIGASLPRPYTELYEQATTHFDVLTEVTVPRLIHWDLWDGNIFIDPATKRITGIIDFERSLWGDPLMEATLGKMSDEIPFIKGYGQRLFDTPAKLRRRHLYHLYLFLIMVIEAYYRNYVDAEITYWARGRLADTLQALGI